MTEGREQPVSKESRRNEELQDNHWLDKVLTDSIRTMRDLYDNSSTMKFVANFWYSNNVLGNGYVLPL
ncbi:hypothetical protein M378DRAFT_159432, partial [Amanita muscaria Koide BX008]